MKTAKMFEELTKDPTKEFKRVDDGLVMSVGYDKVLLWDSGYRYLRLDDEWEEVRKPIGFIRLLEKVKNNGDFSSIDYNYREIDMSYKDCNLYFILRDIAEHSEDDRELADSILNGKWYIED